MEKPLMHSKDLVAGNVEKIAALFPNCVTEHKNAEGKTVLGIDFEKLQQELTSDIIEKDEERYQFSWPGKMAAMREANTPTNCALRPDIDSSVDFENTKNLYIEGDNLEVLKLLQEDYLGKVKMIYIDPPYNTGHEFVYEDDFSENSSDFSAKAGMFDEEGNMLLQNYDKNLESNGRFHTDWLNMMYSRLKISRNLLSDDGVIFISIDDNEVENLAKICNEIFGENNNIAQIPWQSRASIQNDTDFSVNHEYILVYAKKRRIENRRLKENNCSVWHSKEDFVCRPLALDPDKFSNPDNDPRGPWKADPFDAPNVRPNLTYAIVNPKTGVSHMPPNGRHWRMEEIKYQRALADNRIVFGADGKGRPQLKVFYEEKKEFGSVDNSWFNSERIGTTTNGTKELIDLFDGNKVFDTPKPTTLLNKLLYLANLGDEDIIIDYFSGSATTAHSIFLTNLQEQKKLKFIMVQIPEHCPDDSIAFSAGYKNLCELGKDRIIRAGKKIKAEGGANAQHLDTGFRVLKLDTSNMKEVYYTPQDTKTKIERDIFDTASNIKEDRNDLDLLFQVMLEKDITLDAPIRKETIQGKDVYFVDDNYLVAVFAENVPESLIKELAKKEPYNFVMANRGLADDSMADNFEQIFKAYSPETNCMIL